MPDDLIRRSDAKAAIEEALSGTLMHMEYHRSLAIAALDSVPRAGARLDPDEVKAVLAEALSSQPMGRTSRE